MEERGQTFTLEALIGAILLLSAAGFALQAVSVSSNTAGIADTELRGQQAGLAEGVVDRHADDGALKAVILYWNESAQQFHMADERSGFYISPNANTTFGNTSFGASFERMLAGTGIKYNINLQYRGESGSRETQQLVEAGTPSENAVRITETVTLTDDTMLVDPDENPRENATLGEIGEGFYAPNVAPDRDLYNVVRIEVILWEI